MLCEHNILTDSFLLFDLNIFKYKIFYLQLIVLCQWENGAGQSHIFNTITYLQLLLLKQMRKKIPLANFFWWWEQVVQKKINSF